MNINENYKKKILSMIAVFLPTAKIYLFGSRSKGTHHKTSDIDIALDTKEIINRRILIQLKNAIDTLNIPYTVDIVDLNNIPEDLKNEIVRDKKLWN